MNAAAEDRLAAFVAGLTVRDLPAPAVDALLTLGLDTAACMLAALRDPVCARIRSRMAARGGALEASLVGAATRVPAPGAALHNGILAHWSEWDDVFDPGAVHGSAVIFPALLATAEATGRDGAPDGAAFVAAAVAAFEVACRLGALLWRTAHPGWMPTGIAGSIGAAAGAARLAGLDAAGIRGAMGLAATVAGASREPILERVNAKNVMAGFGALKALTALDLARAGIVGPAGFLGGGFGLARLLAPDADVARSTGGLGETFAITAISLKPWPCCRSTHGGIEMALDLHRHEGVRATMIERVEIETSRIVHDLVGAPFEPGDKPRVAAQFSLAYTTALALEHGKVGIAAFDPARIRTDRAVRALADRIAVRPRADADVDPFRQTMRVILRDGRTLERRLDDLAGMPARPLSKAALRAKLEDAAAGALDDRRIDELEAAVGAIPEAGIAPVMAVLRQAGPGA